MRKRLVAGIAMAIAGIAIALAGTHGGDSVATANARVWLYHGGFPSP